MNPYVLRKRTPFLGLVLSLVVVLLGGAMIGVAAYVISRFFYLLIVFPLAMSLAGSLVVKWALKKAKIRNTVIAIAFGLLIGLLIYGSYHYSDYLYTRNEAISFWVREYDIDKQQAQIAFTQLLRERTGQSGFWGFMNLVAQDGISLTGNIMYGGAYIPLPGITLTSAGVWLYWLVEMILVFLLPVWLSSETTPFCERHQTWYGAAKQVGNIDPKNLDLFTSYLGQDLIGNAGELVVEGEQLTHPTIELYIEHCSPKEDRDVLLTIKMTSYDSKNRLNRKIGQRYEFTANQYLDLSNRFIRNV